jgi:hypothetical protein
MILSLSLDAVKGKVFSHPILVFPNKKMGQIFEIDGFSI